MDSTNTNIVKTHGDTHAKPVSAYDPRVKELSKLAERIAMRKKFGANGINSETGTRFDREGYDIDGYDEDGVDREGFDRDGFGTDDRDRAGYDREGFNRQGINKDGFDKNTGLNVNTNTQYDEAGYDINGFDEEGYDIYGYGRDGFDRFGWNGDRINKETGTKFDKTGWDKSGWINEETGTKYGPDGWTRDKSRNAKTGDKYDEQGFDYYGKDREGYDREGFKGGRDREGYDKNGVNKFGFYRNGVNAETGTRYDAKGFNKNFIHKDTDDYFDSEGYSITGNKRDFYDENGFGKNGIHIKTETRFNPLGYNKEGLDKSGYDKEGFHHFANGKVAMYNKDGYDKNGINRKTHRDKDGYDIDGFDIEGYNREGLDKNGYTKEYNARFNKYGVDKDGYLKSGKLDPDVEFAIDFAGSGFKDQNSYATDKDLDPSVVHNRIEFARKKCPDIDTVIANVLQTGNRMRIKVLSDHCKEFEDGKISMSEFWEKHPKMSAANVMSGVISSNEERKKFANRLINGMVQDSNNIEINLQAFGMDRYDVSKAIKGIDEFKKLYSRIPTDGSKEQNAEKTNNIKKLYDITKYFNKYKNGNINNSLLGASISRDGGNTWLEFTGQLIGEAMDELRKDNKLICVQTVKEYILKHH